MSKEGLILFEILTGDLLQELGYERAAIDMLKISIQPSVYFGGVIP
jgi:hypothetical protein